MQSEFNNMGFKLFKICIIRADRIIIIHHVISTTICRAHPLTVNTFDLPCLGLFSIWLLGYDVKTGSWSGIYVSCMLLFLKTLFPCLH